MKDQSVAKTWLGVAALLVLGFAVVSVLNESGTSENAGKPGDRDVETQVPPGSLTGENERISRAERHAAEERAMNPDDRWTAEGTGQQAVGSGVSGKPELAAIDGGGLRGSAEKPPSRRSAAVQGDDGGPVAETAPANPAGPPPGIQLAPEVRLPLAALPVDFQTNEVTARMLDIIVSDYYRDLAAGVKGEGNENGSTLVEDNGETTIVVRNGPAAEAARQRADWRFRTIFGKDAFNRMSMHSNLEARLPVANAE